MEKSESQKRHEEYREAIHNWMSAVNTLGRQLRGVSILLEALETAETALGAAEKAL